MIMKTLVLLCTYNESENIERLCKSILSQNLNLDILVIDDGSPDGTGEIADQLAAASQHIRVLHRPRKSGLGRAISAGFEYAIANDYDACVNMDADMSHDPTELGAMIEHLKISDVVIGSRHIKGGKIIGWPLARQLNHKISNALARYMLGIKSNDVTNSFKAYRIEVLKKVPFQKILDCGFVGHTLLVSAFERLKCSVIEVPSCFIDRHAGKSKMSWDERVGGLKAMLEFRKNFQKQE
ncbi:MAG: hypothetical protein COV45_07585 [Deltaproteobacteria bacterium CG11_big_fil_rev_8_21_14_0_20_47_16]|nr:MAG: hypothetical protein COV45_07585 [Deltaproteobacteria bacterium CG11_big_fil_rev_8_21_14_0_20_47_16]